jgi:2-polyprenyl-3-methyl-5-hydroxy-6-metoxy-1,4-benzoquinol methylase
MNNSTLQKTIYDEIQHDRFLSQKVIREDNRIVEIATKILNQKKESKLKVCDVGCGTGYILEKINSRCKIDAYGIDITQANFSYLNSKGIKTDLVDLESQKIPKNSNFFDVVLSTEVIEHVVNTDNFIYELNRVLKKNGYLILSFPHINTFKSFYLQYILDYPPHFSARYKSPHVHDFSTRLLKKILTNYGFQVIKVQGNKSPLGLFNSVHLLCDQIILIAKKIQIATLDTRNIVWSTNEI